ncbi:MAG: SDR family oxidoreductase [Acidobacteriota bacterium]
MTSPEGQETEEMPSRGPVALVTGGSGGIGRAVVERLTADGWSVAFTFRSRAAEARRLAAATGAHAYPCDLADRRRPEDLVGEVEEVQGPLAALVNNAGIAHQGLVAMTSDDDWDRVMDINLGGAFRFCRAVSRGMLHRRAGSVVNVSSLGALRGMAGQGAYAASKAALLALTRVLAREVGRRGVRVNAVVPGFVATEMTAELPEARVAQMRAGESLPAGVDAIAVAGTVAYLLSADAAAVTGQTLVVDAGASI